MNVSVADQRQEGLRAAHARGLAGREDDGGNHHESYRFGNWVTRYLVIPLTAIPQLPLMCRLG